MKFTEKQAWAYIEDQFRRAEWVDLDFWGPDFLTPDGFSGMCDAIYALYEDGKIGVRGHGRMLLKITKIKFRNGSYLYSLDERGARLRVQFCRRRQKEL